MLCVDQRSQLGQEHLADGEQVALALQHAGELGHVGLEPVLFLVALGGDAQIVNHRVDVVFEFGHLTTGLNLNGTSQVALGHSGGHLRDGTYLCGQVSGQQVDVAGQILPRP